VLHFTPHRRWAVTATLLGILCLTGRWTSAQQPDPAQQYATLRGQWDTLDQQLNGLAERYQAASAQERDTIRAEHATLAERANALFPQLRNAAVAAYRQAPNQDADLAKLVVGIVADDLRNDRYDQAAELAQLLIDNQCPEKAVFGLAGIAAYCRDDFARAEQYLNTAKEAQVLSREGMQYVTDVAFAKQLWGQEQQIRADEAAADDLPRVLLKTSAGDLVVELYENEAPQAVGNFISLVEKGFYNGIVFHRVLPGFMAQGGCPQGTGTGGPGYEIYCECHQPNHRKHFRGTLSMAHAGRDTGGSQFFLTFRRTSHLDGQHTVFGRVIQGVELLDDLQRIDPQASGAKPEPDKIIEAKVLRKRNHPYAATRVE
jgi:cyclophilin family peptidyl-prolyl cis-trans isomerase